MITPPIVVATGEDCAFYRDVGDALAAPLPREARVFDAVGTRVVVEDGALRVASAADGADELAELLRAWLGHMDAVRESTANWSLPLLVRASADHLGLR